MSTHIDALRRVRSFYLGLLDEQYDAWDDPSADQDRVDQEIERLRGELETIEAEIRDWEVCYG
jgi:hypothetical protein